MTKRMWAVLACLLLTVAGPAQAQTDDPGAGGARGGHRGRGGGGGRTPAAAPADAVRLKADPWPRLDAGALVCPTEEALAQHQAAISARLDGRSAPEPRGCRIVARMTPVAVVERHGPGRTEVRLPGPPEALGWTDVAMRTDPPPSR